MSYTYQLPASNWKMATVDRVLMHVDGKATFRFKNGTEITV